MGAVQKLLLSTCQGPMLLHLSTLWVAWAVDLTHVQYDAVSQTIRTESMLHEIYLNGMWRSCSRFTVCYGASFRQREAAREGEPT